MANYKMAEANTRVIPLEDKIFGINKKAKEMIAKEGKDKVINSTIGSLLDDEGNLIVLPSVVEVFRHLSPVDYADYAPIGGTPEFAESIKKAAFGKYMPKAHTAVIATPGGTGAIRSTIQNYSKYGDKVLTSNWYWAPYSTIAQEIGRTIQTYDLFNGKGGFNIDSFEANVKELLSTQDGLVIIINTPAHNPTGYSLSLEDWDAVLAVVKNAVKDNNKKITLAVDVAYLDFAGDADVYREFFPKLDGLPANILSVVAFSLSKSYTMYGMRSGAMICLTSEKEIADEFVTVASFSARGTWSNCNRSAMAVLSRIFSDSQLLETVTKEREKHCEMLVRRGKTFEAGAKEAGLATLPFDAGFFIVVPCEEAEKVGAILQKHGVFTVPMGKGLRISVASISEERCKTLPATIKAAIAEAEASE